MLDAVERRHRQSFRRFCHLARRLNDPELRIRLEGKLGAESPAVRERAQWVLDQMSLPQQRLEGRPDVDGLLRGFERMKVVGEIRLWMLFCFFASPTARTPSAVARAAALLQPKLPSGEAMQRWLDSPAAPMLRAVLAHLATSDATAAALLASL